MFFFFFFFFFLFPDGCEREWLVTSGFMLQLVQRVDDEELADSSSSAAGVST